MGEGPIAQAFRGNETNVYHADAVTHDTPAVRPAEATGVIPGDRRSVKCRNVVGVRVAAEQRSGGAGRAGEVDPHAKSAPCAGRRTGVIRACG